MSLLPPSPCTTKLFLRQQLPSLFLHMGCRNFVSNRWCRVQQTLFIFVKIPHYLVNLEL